ncbi:MAG: hypothetical protein KF912_03250 [Phycisphaeraceae bacterium]|nr:hypothetical protein [Phycisphaeraceae bacterium]
MRTFGSYEATREIARTAFGQVWLARMIGETEERYAVKVIDCGDLSYVADDEIVSARLAAFLEAAKVQGAAGEGWAGVHQSGRLSDSAYVVMDALPLSLTRLVEGRSAVSGHTLVAVTTGIARALLSVWRTSHRGHGNLKPSNVFFLKPDDLRVSPVAITDPAAPGELSSDKGEVADLHAIGEQIYQLVVHRPFKALGGWPVPPGKEWDRLGKVGAGWRELCSELLDPDLKPGQITLESVAERAAALTPPPKPVLRYVLAAVAVISLVVGGFVAWQRSPLSPLDWNSSLWTEVCDDSEWYALVVRAALTGEEDEALRKYVRYLPVIGSERSTFATDTPDLKDLNPDFARVIRNFLLSSSDSVSEAQWERFGEMYPDVYTKKGSFNRVDIKRAVDELADDKVRPPWMLGDARAISAAIGERVMYPTANFESFRTQSISGSQGEISRASYGTYFARFMQKELQREIESQIELLRGQIGESAGDAVPTPRATEEIRISLDQGMLWQRSDTPMAGRIRALASVGRDASRLQTGWKALQETVGKIEGSPASADAVAASTRRALSEAIASADQAAGLQGVLVAIEHWEKTLQQAASIIAERGQTEIDWVSLRTRPDAELAYAQAAEGNLSEEGVRVWVSALADERYWKITEPRPPFTAEREIEATSRALASIDPDDREWRGVEIAAIEAELRSVQERIRVATELPWIRMNRQTVIAEAGATRGEAERLARETEELIAFMRTSATDQIQRWMSEDVSTLTDIVAIRDGWTITRQAIALRLGEDAGGKPAQLRSALWNARRAILWDESPATGEIREAGWAKRLSDWNAASPATRPTSWDEGAWASAVQAKREAMARTLLRAIDGWDFTMRLDRWSNFDEVRSVEERAWESSESWASSCRSMAADFQRIESLIGLWYAPDERPGDGQETIAQLIGKWTGNDTVADARRAVAIVAANAERLGAVSTSDRARRVTLMSGREDDAWLRFAAWRSLAQSGADSMWPAGLDELREEIRSRSELLSQTVNISQETRRAQVRQEIESSGTRRWSNAILAGGLTDVEGIMGLREQMGVIAGASGLDPRAEINIALYEFVASIRDREEEEAKSMAGALVSRVRSLSPATAAPASLDRSLSALERTLGGGVTRKTLDQVLAENGPGRHRDFTVRSKRGGDDGFSAPDAITYANRQSVTFEFIRVNESESEPTYLSADELSIAQVSALLTIFPGGAAKVGETWSTFREPLGPGDVTVWQPRGRTIEPFAVRDSGWWTSDNVGAAEAFPPGMDPPSPPAPESPVQWIEPETVEAIARTIGCRLPTSAEWRLALERERRERAAASRSAGANLRDPTFAAFTAHVAQLRSRSSVRSLEYPHRGGYDPGDLKGDDAFASATLENDGSIWFEPQTHPSRGVLFRHLIGNVAEFVNDSPGAKGGYGVIGGSALSISPDPERLVRARTDSAFADVGARLAFSLRDLKPPMWAALLQDLGSPVPYLFLDRVAERP